MIQFQIYAIYLFYRFLMATWRVKVQYHPEAKMLLDSKSPLLLAHWHGHELALIHLVKSLKLATLTSKSKDGQRVAGLIDMLGGVSSKGSSSRSGSSGLLGLVRLLKSGRVTSIAVDGPRGPIYQVKPGIFEMSKICKAPIIPVAASASSTILFEKAWNKAFLPLPFSKIHIIFDQPLHSYRLGSDPRGDELKNDLAFRLNAAGQAAAKSIAGK